MLDIYISSNMNIILAEKNAGNRAAKP